MKDVFENFSKYSEPVILSSEEKKAMKDALALFADAHPVRNTVELRQTEKMNTGSHLFFSFRTFMLKLRPMTIALIMVLLFGASTAAAAENALPGDALYLVKLHVNEQIRDLVTVSSESEADWAAEKTGRRLIEAEKLAESGRLTPVTQGELASRIETYIGDMSDARDNIENNEKLKAYAKLEAVLDTHTDIIDSLIFYNKVESKSEIQEFRMLLKTHTDTIAEERSQVEADVFIENENSGQGIEKAAEKKYTVAERKLAEVKKYISQKDNSLNISSEVVAKLAHAEDALAQGKLELETGSYRIAFTYFQESMRAAEQAKSLFNAMYRLKINVEIDSETSLNASSTVRTDREDRDQPSQDDDGRDSQNSDSDKDNADDSFDSDPRFKEEDGSERGKRSGTFRIGF